MKVRRRKKRKSPVIPVASFGDIAFLLIIFFMVASQFMQESHIDVNEAKSADIDEVEEAQVRVVMDKDGKLWLQGQECPMSVLENAVDALIADRQDKRVLLKIDRDQKQEAFGDILMALSDAGAQIVLLGAKERE